MRRSRRTSKKSRQVVKQPLPRQTQQHQHLQAQPHSSRRRPRRLTPLPMLGNIPLSRSTTRRDLSMTNSATQSRKGGGLKELCRRCLEQRRSDCLEIWAPTIQEGRDHPHQTPYLAIWDPMIPGDHQAATSAQRLPVTAGKEVILWTRQEEDEF